MGGTISAMYASLFPEKPLKNLVLLGLWTLFSRSSEAFFDPDLLVEAFGNFPEDLLERFVGAGTYTAKPLADRCAAWFCATLRGFLQEVTVDSWLAVSR